MSQWETKHFQDILTITNGKNQKKVENPKGKYPIYGSGGVMGYADDYICVANTVVIGRKGNINKPIFVEEPFWNVDTAFGLVAKQELLLPKYLYYFCLKFDFLRLNTTVTIPSLTKSNLLKIEIPLPPIETQQKIAKTLDTVADLLKLRKQQLAELDLLIQSVFYEMFGDPVTNEKGWEVLLLKDVCTDIVDCPHSTPKHQDKPTVFPSIRTSELKNGELDWSAMKYVDEEEYKKRIKRIIPKANDIIYGREGSYGEAVLLPEGHYFCLGQRVMLLRVNDKICLPEFLWYCIRSDYIYAQAKNKNVGATVGHVNVADIKKFWILIPPIKKQKEFTDFIKLISNLKFDIQKSMNEMDMLFDGLMQKYFE